MKTTVLAIALLTFAVGAHAQIVALPATAPTQPAPHPDVTIYTLTLHPMAPPRPALKYTLLPMPVDRTPGNAAALYYQACLAARLGTAIKPLVHPGPTTNLTDPIDECLDAPLDRLPRDQAAALLKHRSEVLALCDLAATREECRWEIPWRERGFGTLLSHLSTLRDMSSVLALRCRVELADGKFDLGARALQSSFSLIHSLDQGDMLVHSLVGVGIGRRTCERLREWTTVMGAPNLYWALADLPRPMIDLRRGMDMERGVPDRVLPTVAKVRKGGLTAEDGEKLLGELLVAMSGSLYDRQPTVSDQVGVRLLMTASAMRAEVYLLEHGRSAREMREMEPAQAVGLYWLETYEQWIDELTKWHDLPYWQSQAGVARSKRAYTEMLLHEPLGAMTDPILMFIPALDRAHMAAAHLDRELAMLRCIEGLRAYAAGHGGALPAKLDDMTDTPAPLDPMTNEPFEYRVNGNAAVLDSKPNNDPAYGRIRYEITMEP